MTKEPSAIFNELDDIVSSSRPKKCLFVEQIRSFSKDDQEALALALANPKYTNVSILKVCQKRGATFSKWAVGHHRKGECACVSGE